MPLVSVIMPVYNGEEYLADAIDSIVEQTFTDFELLIVDDGSTDGSAEIIRSFEAQDGRIHFIQLEENFGVGAARNHALSAARGEYVTSMDCDDISVKTRLEQQVDFLNGNPEIGAVGGSGPAISEDLATVMLRLDFPPTHAMIIMNLFYGQGFIFASIMFRRKFLTAVDGYDANLRICEDLDLVLRLLFNTEIRFANLREDLMIRRAHPRSVTRSRPHHTEMIKKELLHRALERLWNSPLKAGTMDRLLILSRGEKLSWAERRATKNDLRRLSDSLIAHSRVDPGDRAILIAAMNRRLEQASPRLWQQFCHWRRHRFQRRK